MQVEAVGINADSFEGLGKKSMEREEVSGGKITDKVGVVRAFMSAGNIIGKNSDSSDSDSSDSESIGVEIDREGIIPNRSLWWDVE